MLNFFKHFQKTMPEKYSDNFEVVVEEAERMKYNVKKMKRWYNLFVLIGPFCVYFWFRSHSFAVKS